MITQVGDYDRYVVDEVSLLWTRRFFLKVLNADSSLFCGSLLGCPAQAVTNLEHVVSALKLLVEFRVWVFVERLTD